MSDISEILLIYRKWIKTKNKKYNEAIIKEKWKKEIILYYVIEILSQGQDEIYMYSDL